MKLLRIEENEREPTPEERDKAFRGQLLELCRAYYSGARDLAEDSKKHICKECGYFMSHSQDCKWNRLNRHLKD